MRATCYQFDPRPSEPLRFTAVRYQPENPPSDGITLIVAHATGTHKETWAPLLNMLFTMQAASSDVNRPKILEAWSMECPNHGESAVINDKDIREKFPDLAWSGWIYPRAMHAFLLSKPDGIDFNQRTLVALGHSHGGNSLLLLESLQTFRFEAIVLLDPTLGRESPTKDHMQRVLTQLTWNKKDTWPNRKSALKDLTKQPGYRNWHPDVLRLFIEKGLRSHPAAKLPDPWCFKDGVTLACSRANEAACNLANDHHDYAFDYLHQCYREGKVIHLIHSAADEFDGAALKQAQVDREPLKKRGPVSVQRIEKGGHMFVQTNPEPTARAVWNALYHVKNHRFPKESTIPVKARL